MLVCPVRLLKEFSPHGMACPSLHQLPAGQASHSSSVVSPVPFPTVPRLHAVGAELPRAHHECLRQVLHAVAPCSLWNVPASQRWHEALPALGAYEPGAQLAGSHAPVVQNEPAGHSMQSSADVMEMFNLLSVAFW